MGAARLAAQDISFSTATGGVTVSGSKPWKAGFGAVNGLGAGSAPSGTTILTAGVSGGVWYTTPYNMVISGAGSGSAAVVKAYVSTNFAHPALLALQSCYPSASCSSAASYTTLSTSSSAPTVVIPQPGITTNGTVTASLALFVANTDGASAYTGADSATITYNIYNGSNQLKHTEVLTLNTPNETIQTAIQLTLATASGGLTISPASDFAANFGNTNGLGIGPGAGLSVVSASGGVTYATPYLIQPAFSSFGATTCTISAYYAKFANASALALQDASSAGGPYTNLSTNSGAPTPIASNWTSGSSNTRYLGLFVSAASGAGAFPGTSGGNGNDNATVTYSMTVP